MSLTRVGASKQLSEAEEAEGASLYDLVVTVPHIQDTRTGGNLVTHIKVGETYHQRKEVRQKKVGVSEPQRKCVFFFCSFRASHTSSGTSSTISSSNPSIR